MYKKEEVIIVKHKAEEKAFADLSKRLSELKADIRDDLFDGKNVYIACDESVEKECVEITQDVFDRFDYLVEVKAIRKDGVIRVGELFRYM